MRQATQQGFKMRTLARKKANLKIKNFKVNLCILDYEIIFWVQLLKVATGKIIIGLIFLWVNTSNNICKA